MRAVSTSVSVICTNSIVSEGLKAILLDEEFSIVGQHKTCEAMIDAKGEVEIDPEIIMVDADASRDIPREVGAVREAFPDSRVVILHKDLEFDCLINAFEAGADGYILKEISCESLVNCLQLAARGEKIVPGALVKQLPHFAHATAQQTESALSELLSEREIATLRCLVMGYPNKIIARRLDIGEATVKVHVKAILRKLNVQNRTQAAICAVNHGLQAAAPMLDMKGPEPQANAVHRHDDAIESAGVRPFMLSEETGPKLVARA